jgi:hypothetical protein
VRPTTLSDTRVTHLRCQEYLPDKFWWLYAITRAPLGQVTDEAGNRAAVIAPAGYARRRRTPYLPLMAGGTTPQTEPVARCVTGEARCDDVPRGQCHYGVNMVF